MSSIIPGYEYDIFISYRQKDNKYDGWVSEFVENLKRELDATFKEEISLFFDINPHDGLLETHDVDDSLEKKLKCLICIPIISRTYCDPKSFAWEHEFRKFIYLAANDQFGLKVTLTGGNVASRILPVRIHDLDAPDIKLFESVTGGALRSVDFVYKETGVNRQLRAKDDDIVKSTTQVLYRDQINKVALAIRDIIESMRNIAANDRPEGREAPANEKPSKKTVPHEETVVVQKRPEKDKKQKIYRTGKRRNYNLFAVRPRLLVTGIIIIIALLTLTILIFNRRARITWAKETALPDIEKFFNESNNVSAFNLLTKAESYIPKDTVLKLWASRVGTFLTVITDPPGADVCIREYSDTAGVWQKLGQTPVENIRVPKNTFYVARIEKPGYETVFAVTRTGSDTLSRKLFEKDRTPPGMVYVDEFLDEVKNTIEPGKGFFIDKYEVTNRQYKKFIDEGGYRNSSYWKNEFIKDGRKLSWEEAMKEFKDKTGRPGPSTWEAGDYPEGQDNFPVSGISWYEAAAFAEYEGKTLPTGDHWDSGSGYFWPDYYQYIHPKLYQLSNYNDLGPEAVGKQACISRYGAFDMAGNVREWCWNETSVGRIIAGGGWADETYMFSFWDQLPPFDRSPMNGVRCALYIDKESTPESAFRFIPLELHGNMDYSQVIPVPESIFLIYKNQFLYDRTALNPVTEERDESPEDWIMEKVSFDAAYPNDRMILYLFLPRNSSPPFQTLIFFPGSYAISEKDLLTGGSVASYLDFVLKSGRAVAYPVYFRTYERNDGRSDSDPTANHQYTEVLIKWVKDFSRTIDYLATRPDIDTTKLGFYGHSWGGRLGGIIPAVEGRLAINITVVGGLSNTKPLPEADGINYVPRITIPTLMLNGRYDPSFPLEKSVMPFFRLLGTPEADKRLCIYETGHYTTKSDRTREILNWCDKYLGPAK